MDPDGPGRTRTDPDGPGQTRMDPDRPGWTRTGTDEPKQTQMEPGRTQRDLNRPRWTWCSHWIQTVLPDFGTNDCGIRIGDLESEDIRTFILKNSVK